MLKLKVRFKFVLYQMQNKCIMELCKISVSLIKTICFKK